MPQINKSFHLLFLGDTGKAGGAQCSALGWWGKDAKMHIILVDFGMGYIDQGTRIIPDINALATLVNIVIEAIVVTHIHGDHIGGIEWFLQSFLKPGTKAVVNLSPRVQIVGLPSTIEFLKSQLGRVPTIAQFIAGGRFLALEPYQPALVCPKKDEPVLITGYPTVHTTLGSAGVLISHLNQGWSVFLTGDFAQFERLPSQATAVVFDATAADKPGYGLREEDSLDRLANVFQSNSGSRLIFAVPPRDLAKVKIALEAGARAGRKYYCVLGEPLARNIEIFQRYFCDVSMTRLDYQDFLGIENNLGLLFTLPSELDPNAAAMLEFKSSDMVFMEFPNNDDVTFDETVSWLKERVRGVLYPRQNSSFFPSHAHILDIGNLLREITYSVAIPYQGDQGTHEFVKDWLQRQRICGSPRYDIKTGIAEISEPTCQLIFPHAWFSLQWDEEAGHWFFPLKLEYVLGVPALLREQSLVKYPLKRVSVKFPAPVNGDFFSLRGLKVLVDCGKNGSAGLWPQLRTLIIAMAYKVCREFDYSKDSNILQLAVKEYLGKFLPVFAQWETGPQINVEILEGR